MTDTAKVYEGWAILELMGHRRLGGYVTEVEVAGAPMLRLDIPERETLLPVAEEGSPEQRTAGGESAPEDVYATQFYSAAALYCLTPTTEAMARAARSRPTPVHQWELPRPELVASDGDVIESDWSDHLDDDLPV